MQEQIQTYFKHTFPDRQDILVSEPQRITTGWETEIFSFDVDYILSGAPIHESIVMRMYPSDDADGKSAKEFAVMKKMYKVGYPVPQVTHLERKNSPWGKPFVLMERIEGDILWPQLVNSSAENQQALLAQFCDLFVQLHQLDWRPFAGDRFRVETNNSYQFVDSALDQGTIALAQFGLTGFSPIVDWLQDRRGEVPCDHPSPIHFDFHPGNIMLRPDGTAVVLDWSGFDISDTRFDLAWTLVLVSSYEGAAWRESILGAYEQRLGAAVQQIEYFEVFACVRRLFSIVASIQGGAEKLGMDPSAVALMKEQMVAHRRVYNLLVERTGLRVVEVERMFESVS